MKTAFIAFAMATAISSAFATYCEPHRFICTDPWGDELVSEEENAVLLTGGQVALFDLARPRYTPRSERDGIIDLALPAYPPSAGGVADIRGFGGWDLA